jgi:O-antigen ligase
MPMSGTSVAAFIATGVTLALGALSLRATRLMLLGGWVIATIFAVPLSSMPYALGWQHWFSPQEAGQTYSSTVERIYMESYASVVERIYIWKFTADKIYERPITGIGIRSTREVHGNARSAQRREGKDGTRRRVDFLHSGWHPHNIFLQTWFELGAVGAGLLLAFGLATLWQIRHLPPLLEGAAYALFAACCVIGLSGFDLWQTWLMASLGLAWTAVLLTAHLPAANVSLRDSFRSLQRTSATPLST